VVTNPAKLGLGHVHDPAVELRVPLAPVAADRGHLNGEGARRHRGAAQDQVTGDRAAMKWM
jgi:hypothetical protein